jgi:hypothetical protein
MHEPLPRNWRLKDRPNATLALVRACAFVVILAVALVGVALIVGEFTADNPDQIAAAAKQTTGSAAGARDAAPSSNDLFSGMPLP